MSRVDKTIVALSALAFYVCAALWEAGRYFSWIPAPTSRLLVAAAGLGALFVALLLGAALGGAPGWVASLGRHVAAVTALAALLSLVTPMAILTQWPVMDLDRFSRLWFRMTFWMPVAGLAVFALALPVAGARRRLAPPAAA